MANVVVRRVQNKLYPCVKCRYRNNKDRPNTVVHYVQQRVTGHLTNIRGGRGDNMNEIVGECSDFLEQS